MTDRNQETLPFAVPLIVMAVVGLLSLLAYRTFRNSAAPTDVDWVDAAGGRVRTGDELRSAGARPAEHLSAGYVSSNACQECHEDSHQSWRRSHHRKMTQVATAETVVGDFDDRIVQIGRQRFHMRQSEGQFWVEMTDPESHVNSSVRREYPVVMTTGSHHMQMYWYPTGKARTLGQVPLVYLIPDQRWALRKSVLLAPPGTPHAETRLWNTTCMRCHTTFGQSRPLDETLGDETLGGQRGLDTRAAELGISCEACHGPGEKHVAYRRRPPDAADKDPIVNPATLPHDLSSQVCGQCHAVSFPRDRDSLNRERQDGPSYRPGDQLADHRRIVRNDSATVALLSNIYSRAGIEAELRRYMWPDGMIRVAGHEYNGLLESACHTKGQLSCLSCHQMHQAEDDQRLPDQWARDQLKVEAIGNQACLVCHDAQRYDAAGHTHHAAGSSGSQCSNCHMPHTSYGLAKAVRSHQIDRPSVTKSITSGRPNACNLCHLDKPMQWAADHLTEWYGADSPPVDHGDVAGSLVWVLQGDAGQRALAAWSMGWGPAVEASGQDWLVPFLARLLEDPYDAVRLIAFRSLRRHPQFADLEYDFDGPPEALRATAEAVMDRWRQSLAPDAASSATLIGAGGALDEKRIEALLLGRSKRIVELPE